MPAGALGTKRKRRPTATTARNYLPCTCLTYAHLVALPGAEGSIDRQTGSEIYLYLIVRIFWITPIHPMYPDSRHPLLSSQNFNSQKIPSRSHPSSGFTVSIVLLRQIPLLQVGPAREAREASFVCPFSGRGEPAVLCVQFNPT